MGKQTPQSNNKNNRRSTGAHAAAKAAMRSDEPASVIARRDPLTLTKGSHRWSFSCDPGEEPALLRRLSELAGDPEMPFDWFDAALVSHQLGKRLKPGLTRIEQGGAGGAGETGVGGAG